MTDVNLTIEFGGLCLFVSRKKQGLWVLLPDHTMMDPRHCPMLVVPTKPGYALLYSLEGKVIELESLQSYMDAPSGPPDLSRALDVSSYAKSSVADCYLTDPPGGFLACRVSLPEGAKLSWRGGEAKIHVKGQGQKTVNGRLAVSMHLKNFNDSAIQFGDIPVDVSNGQNEVYIVNIRRCDLNRRKPRSHKKGDPIHGNIYYTLLGDCGVGVDGPELTVDVPPIDTDDSPCNEQDCPSDPNGESVTFKAPPVEVPWVDTHDCAIGTGA